MKRYIATALILAVTSTMWVMTTHAATEYFRDAFTDSSGTLLENHTPTTTGTSWTELIDVSGGSIAISSSNQAAANGTLSDGSLYTADGTYSSADYKACVTMVDGDSADDVNILAVRIQDSDNMYALQFNTETNPGTNLDEQTRLYEKVTGTWTALAPAITAPVNTDVVCLLVEGTTISVEYNGVEQDSVTDTSHSAAGKAGMGMGAVIHSSSDQSGQILDDFYVEELTAPAPDPGPVTDSDYGVVIRRRVANVPKTVSCSYDDSWNNRIKLTVDNAKVDATLTDYPVYVSLTDLPSDFHRNVAANGADIRVTKSDGVTELPREVVFYNTASDEGELHFKADSLSSSADTVFYLYYGNSGASEPAVSDTYGRNNVWTNSFSAVWHLEADPSGTAPQMVDSTGNGNDGTSNGTMTSGDRIDGNLGKGIDFDGSDDYIDGGSGTDFDGLTNYSVSSWIRVDSLGGSIDETIISKQDADSVLTFWLRVQDSNVDQVRWSGETDSEGMNGSTAVSQDTWHNVVGTYDGTNAKVYLDGSLDGNELRDWSQTDAVNPLIIGAKTGGIGDYLSGTIDEVRIASVARTADWFSTEYNNHNHPSSFYSVGSQENCL